MRDGGDRGGGLGSSVAGGGKGLVFHCVGGLEWGLRSCGGDAVEVEGDAMEEREDGKARTASRGEGTKVMDIGSGEIYACINVEEGAHDIV